MSEEELTVLVAVDFSEHSRRALAWTYDYAIRAPCQVHLLHVVEDHISDLLPSRRVRLEAEMAAIVREAEEELGRMAKLESERAAVGTVHHHVARGRPAHEIVFVAEKIGAEMIVVGSHGHGRLRSMVGSVAERVVRHATCPVVVVKTT